MIETTSMIEQCYALLEKTNSNVVWEVLRQSGEFQFWKHYPEGDVFDKETHAQYYYHAHPNQSSERWEEHGHFHLFMRESGIPKTIKPFSLSAMQAKKKTDTLCHLCGISMDKFGKPLRLFTTNRWVTNETWYPAKIVISLLSQFQITHAWPAWPTNIWITELVKAYRKEISDLLLERDHRIQTWQARFPEKDVFEDRSLEITSSHELILP